MQLKFILMSIVYENSSASDVPNMQMKDNWYEDNFVLFKSESKAKV